jgi:hypothetical protein
MLLLTLTILSACCKAPTNTCPAYPPMPEEVKQVFRDNYTPTVHQYLNTLLKLRKKLDACRGE